jgi:RNA polymerase sigma-70 factor (ECF subfamily)
MTDPPGAGPAAGVDPAAGADPAAGVDPVAGAVAEAHRREWGFVLAATVRLTRDLDLAEECVQDAYARALMSWRNSGVPRNAGAWLTTAARNRAIDVLRRDALFRRAVPQLVLEPAGEEPGDDPLSDIPDDRLRLICTCCHPALAQDAQVALTLRLLCGLSTAEVARAFLVSESTMAARITREKKKIAAAGIPYRVPSRRELPGRVEAIAAVVYLIFTAGHTAASGHDLVRPELLARALDLAQMLHTLLPRNPEVTGLLALLVLTDARRAARVDPAGELVLLAGQDRTLWDREAIAAGERLTRSALRGRPVSRYAVQAAIAAVHAAAPAFADTDWPEIVGLYDVLLASWPSPVVALNRAIAVGFADGAAAGLAELDALALEPQLAGYGYRAAARADLLRRLGRGVESAEAYREALLLTENVVERRFLERRLAEVSAG